MRLSWAEIITAVSSDFIPSKFWTAALLLAFVHFPGAAWGVQRECPPLSLDQMTIQGITKLRDSGKITTVEKLLCHLPDTLQENYVLFHGSKGAHKSTYMAPRALLFLIEKDPKFLRERKLKFVLSFHGDPREPDYDAVEMFEVDENRPLEDQFIFSHLAYLPAPARRGSQTPQIADQEFCQQCHSGSSRLVQEAYPVWNGQYGSDEFHMDPFEYDQFQVFLGIAGSHPRYKYLRNLDKFFESQFEPDRKFVMANSLFNDALLIQNERRVIGKLRALPDYDLYKFAYAGAFLECPSVDKFLPEDIRRQHSDASKILTSVASISDEKLAQTIKNDPNFNRESVVVMRFLIDTAQRAGLGRSIGFVPVGALRYLVEGRGFSMLQWALDFDADRYRFGSGHQGDYDLAQVLLDFDRSILDLGERLPNYNSKADVGFQNRRAAWCSTLQNASLNAFQGIQKVATGPKRKPYPQTFSKVCATCHQESTDSAIRFKNEAVFLEDVMKSGNSDKILYRIGPRAGVYQMPPNSHSTLTRSQIDEIQNYLKSLGFYSKDRD